MQSFACGRIAKVSLWTSLGAMLFLLSACHGVFEAWLDYIHDHHGEEPPRDGGTVGEAPKLFVESPTAGSLVAEPTATISGHIENYTTGVMLHVNGVQTVLSANGEFSLTQELFFGTNSISFVLADRDATLIEQLAIGVTYLPDNVVAARIDAGGGSISVTDPTSPVYGTRLDIPADAVNDPLYAYLDSDAEHFPALPYGMTALSAPVNVGPVGASFFSPARLTIAVDATRIPEGSSDADVQVLAFGDEGWTQLAVISRETGTVTAAVEAVAFDLVVAAVAIPLRSGELRVDSSPAHATIYVDGRHTGLYTPATVDDVGPGDHELKIYLPGYNEVFQNITQPEVGGAEVSVTLSKTTGTTPNILLDQDLSQPTDVMSAELTLTGEVRLADNALPRERIVFSLNGRDTIDTTDANGRFNSAVVLRRGLNRLQLRTTADEQTYSSPVYEIRLGSPDITIALNWGTSDTDIDLHVFAPSGAHAWFDDLLGIPNGSIDRDDVDGFGPEIFTLSDPPPGKYRVAVNSYLIVGKPTTANLEVRLGNTVLFSNAYTFTGEDENAGSGQGGDPSAYWDAFTFEVGPIRIARLAPPQDSTPEEAVFTTQPDERSILVELEAPSIVMDSDIGIAVTETHENFVLMTSSLSGRSIRFDASHRQPTVAEFAKVGYPLHYDVIAFQKSNRTDTETQPNELTQDARSRIRQEYVDARGGGRAGFTLPIPSAETILTASGFPGSVHFSFNDFVQDCDIAGMGVFEESVQMADSIRDGFGHAIRLTSAYRNPRNNARLATSAANSSHQTGNAVDLNPLHNLASYPPSIRCNPNDPASVMPLNTYAAAQAALVCVAKRLYPRPTYDAFLHVNHLHVERN